MCYTGKAESKNPAKSPAKSPAKGPAKSPSKVLTIYKSPSRRKSLRASILKDQGPTKSPVKNSPLRWIDALKDECAFDEETPMLLNMEAIGIKSLACDQSQSPFSRRRSARLSARYSPQMIETEAQSAITLDASVGQAVHEGLEELGRAGHDFIEQDEKNACGRSMPSDACERDTCSKRESSRGTTPNTVLVTWESSRALPPAVSDSKTVAILNNNRNLEQNHFTHPPPLPTSLDLVSLEPLDDSSQEAPVGAQHNDLGTIAPSTASPKLPFSHYKCPSEPALCASDSKKPDLSTDDPLPNEKIKEPEHAIYDDRQDELLDGETFGSDRSSPHHKDQDKKLQAISDDEARLSQTIDMVQQVSHSMLDEILDAGDGISKDDRAAALNDSNAQKDTGSDGNLHDNNEDMLEESIDVEASRLRPRTRVSDETVMLKEFLSRAQARRAASQPTEPPKSPSRSLRKRSKRSPLQQLDTNSPSPTKPKGPLVGLAALPESANNNVHVEEDLGKSIADLASQRRSTRTRLATPNKTPLNVPSLIPLRRTDGTDPVVLQKSANQELSIVTRANTRRNKGRARLPKMMLVELAQLAEKAVEQDDDSIPHRQQSTIKFVRWDENRLVQYQEAPIDIDEGNKTRTAPKVRRLRGLGATNETPAPKRVSQALLTPAASSRVTKLKAASK